jgi:glycosyltransferase involved in cell wall biosynthesis
VLPELKNIRFALVHEWFTPKATGGSELVVREILQQIDADVYALIDFESSNPSSYLYQRQIETTFLQFLPFARNGVQKYLPFLPIAIEQLDLRNHQVILSSSHAVAKGILTSPHQIHICYCHTPMRYAWDLTFDYLDSSRLGKGIPGWITRALLHYLRHWDVISANRVDYFLANSQHTARRIWRCYRREAKVIYPPVDIQRFLLQPEKSDFYVTVARLVSYKKVELIVRAFNQLGKELIVIGTGPELEKMQQLAQPNVKILNSQPNSVVEDYMSRAKAFVYGACEDFGIALVEAQACGTPVIAYGAGGALETVIDIRQHPQTGTGILFRKQTEDDIIEAVKVLEELYSQFNPETLRQNAAKFSVSAFQKNYVEFVRECIPQEFYRQ